MQFEVFFDGDCPLCVKEIRMLRWLEAVTERHLGTAGQRPERSRWQLLSQFVQVGIRAPPGCAIFGCTNFGCTGVLKL